ncbi:prolyl oligopeptidase family serine peptidase [Pedobacter xixiisoli]|uniref:Dienelactone hydrolase family protein n=1 Tax=Pedobacter xixiisoli TaxID=1476464 RepID=A0A285ZPH0_9SPHI|nr:prolyl oligopeptidase family serine peptidase [Pedobacter xixiisoli]SOD11520.1 Dienelactone hydrolase family protein [Pedobacter xixiisoli]
MKKHLFVFCILWIEVNNLQAQLPEIKTISFDSTAFLAKRNELNKIDVSSFAKLNYEVNSLKLPYRLLSPKKIKTGAKYPLVIALHNSTRLGNDNEKQLEPLTRTWLQDEFRTKFPSFVLAPQFEDRPTQYATNEAFGAVTATPQQNLKVLILLVETLMKNPQIDKERIYLIGYSMGGSTAQHLLSQKPDWFAATISVAGVPDVSNLPNIKNKPIWLIHGRKDDENPFNGSNKLFAQLKGNKKARFTIYENLDHNTINFPLLGTDELAKWLFKWRR